MKNTPLPPTLLRCVAGVPLMLVMRSLAGSPAQRGNSKLAGEWLRNAHAFRVALGQIFGRRGAAAANSMMLLPPAADLMMRTAGARIMSISGGSACPD